MKYIRLLTILTVIISSCDDNESCFETGPSAVNCTAIYLPVCGCNGKTYGNACVAESYGIDEYTSGRCE